MEIVINDANILIDLCNAGLLPYCKKLGMEFRTLDVVMKEITDSGQQVEINRIIDDGTLRVCGLTGVQLLKVLEYKETFGGHCNLSVQDISVMVYAQEYGCRLLTGDKALRNRAAASGINVSGILYITDAMTREKVISDPQMADALRLLMKTNSRLPHKLIRERICKLTGEEE